ncbi:hypothetical protein [Bacillus sp. 165]|uniref:hypothetical protein n=1 Tax=Bacillus sp. 165 TaxID=1529117 RepID=UPI001ADCBFC9|nr:hypothetical protein [Bacillus sp. 165]MBO9128629.1 hypothetical protein [Bacillus sp. 165]
MGDSNYELSTQILKGVLNKYLATKTPKFTMTEKKKQLFQTMLQTINEQMNKAKEAGTAGK